MKGRRVQGEPGQGVIGRAGSGQPAADLADARRARAR